MATFKDMTKDGTIKRADRHQVRYEDIHIEPGFNPEGRHDTDDEDDKSLLAHIAAGGTIPAMDVRPRDDGGVWLVDGHRRYIQIGKADKAGAPLRDKDGILWVDVKQFHGGDAERAAHIVNSQSNKKLTPLQLGQIYARLRGFKKSPDEIATMVRKTRQHVDQMLILADANTDVKEAVKNGDISATEAVKLQRKNGDNTGQVIKQAKDDKGGKVTAKALRPWAPPAKYAAPLAQHTRTLLNTIQPDILARAGSLATFDQPDEIVSVNLSMRQLFVLVQTVETIEEAREVAQINQRKKAEKAAQQEIQPAAGA